ncbi:helix-turn-helix domain-containing protein, partial [Microvirga sp. 3-52]|nr:helix-turn-helix domain-containing protein [Microvirga sp. 3-52]
MSTLLNTIDTYKLLQPFAHIDELNKNTIHVRELYADQLTPSTKEVLDVLHRYSCKYPGVCYLSKNKIAEMVGVSRRTVIRACNQLETLGIISQHELKRHNGDKRQSSNAIVFVAVEKEDDNNNVTPECHT